MREKDLSTYSEAAAELGVTRWTVADLVKLIGLTPKRMTNGKAKGLNPADIRAIRKVLDTCSRVRPKSCVVQV